MTPMAEAAEKRKIPRVKLHAPMVIRWRSATRHGLGMVTNISMAGCYILTQITAELGEHIFLELEESGLPEIEGRVRFVDAEVGMGLEFLNLSAETALGIVHLLKIHAPVTD